MNSARLRQRLSSVYASATREGSREFHASSAIRAFWAADSIVNGGIGARFTNIGLYPVQKSSCRQIDVPTETLQRSGSLAGGHHRSAPGDRQGVDGASPSR